MNSKPIALIVAGGTGTRMGTSTPKQFLLLRHKPVLMHTLERFHESDCDLVLVLPEYQIPYWKELCTQYQFTLSHKIVPGGTSRFQSVRNGLEQVPGEVIVAIHDGVRPCVDPVTIKRTIDAAKKTGNAIACVKLKDSIRKLDDEDNFSVDRTQFVLIQTPQTFQASLIKEAYLQPESLQFTDDASVLEKLGQKIHLVEGSYANIKITTPEDMAVAEVLIAANK